VSKRNVLIAATLLVVPAATLGAVGAYLLINPAQNKYLFVKYVTVLVTLCVLVGLEAGGLVLLWLRERGRRRRLQREREVSERASRVTVSHIENLEKELERLSAMREVYRAARLEQALEESLQVVRQEAQAEEIALFLLEPGGEKLFPHGLADATGSYVGERLEGKIPDDDGVSACLEHRSAYQAAQGDRLRVLVPLSLEGDSFGVLAATTRLTGDPDSQAGLVENSLPFLEEVAPHVASVVSMTFLRTQAILDPLTKLYNRGQFDRHLAEQVALSVRRGRDLSLVMIDLDHFKQVNDTHGHQAGDEVLTTVGSILKDNLRTYDTAYRYGGEELSFILPETTEKNAQVLVERVRQGVKRHPFRGAGGAVFYVTLSAGIAQFDRARMTDAKDLLGQADAALYRAKQDGRDRVVLASVLTAPEAAPAKPTGRRRKRAKTKRS